VQAVIWALFSGPSLSLLLPGIFTKMQNTSRHYSYVTNMILQKCFQTVTGSDLWKSRNKSNLQLYLWYM
jgi:hypothetical protein